MFGLNKRHLENRCANLEGRVIALLNQRDSLEDQVHTTAAELTKVKLTKKISEEEIAHKIKMREETVDIDKQKEIAAVERKADKRVAEVKDEYRDKVEKQLEKRGDELKKMYSEILARLPDVNLAITQHTKK